LLDRERNYHAFSDRPRLPRYGLAPRYDNFFISQTGQCFLIFFAGTLLAGAVEFVTAYFLEKLFKDKWWDYSRYRFNIQGRVTFLGSQFSESYRLLIKYIHRLSAVSSMFASLVSSVSSASIFILYRWILHNGSSSSSFSTAG
jgi:uncharacterized membrane protein